MKAVNVSWTVAAMLFVFSNLCLAQVAPYKGMWLTGCEILALPEEGEAWEQVRAVALSDWPTFDLPHCSPDLKNQEVKHGVRVLAGALFYARTGDGGMRHKVALAIRDAKQTLDGAAEWGPRGSRGGWCSSEPTSSTTSAL